MLPSPWPCLPPWRQESVSEARRSTSLALENPKSPRIHSDVTVTVTVTSRWRHGDVTDRWQFRIFGPVSAGPVRSPVPSGETWWSHVKSNESNGLISNDFFSYQNTIQGHTMYDIYVNMPHAAQIAGNHGWTDWPSKISKISKISKVPGSDGSVGSVVFRKEINGQDSSTRRIWAADVSTISTLALGVVDTEQKLRTDPGSLEYLNIFGYPDIHGYPWQVGCCQANTERSELWLSVRDGFPFGISNMSISIRMAISLRRLWLARGTLELERAQSPYISFLCLSPLVTLADWRFDATWCNMMQRIWYLNNFWIWFVWLKPRQKRRVLKIVEAFMFPWRQEAKDPPRQSSVVHT